MESIYLVAAFCFFAAVLSTALANRFKISIALMEIIVGAVITSTLIPTIIANKFFLPSHLLEEPVLDDQIPDEKDIMNKL